MGGSAEESGRGRHIARLGDVRSMASYEFLTANKCATVRPRFILISHLEWRQPKILQYL